MESNDHHYDRETVPSLRLPSDIKIEKNVFKKSDASMPREPSKVQIFIEGLPMNVQVEDIVKHFSTIGKIKLDRESREHKVWLYKDKRTGDLTGEATVTYINHETQKLALEAYDKRLFKNRYLITVSPAIVKSHMASPPTLPPRPSVGLSQNRAGREDRGDARKYKGDQPRVKREFGENRMSGIHREDSSHRRYNYAH